MAWILYQPEDEETGTELDPNLYCSPSPFIVGDSVFYFLSDGQSRETLGLYGSWDVPVELESSTEYTWYAEHWSNVPALKSTSPTWSFTTRGPPGAPTIVSPTPTGVTGITLDETPLEWAAGNPAGDTYEIYFRELGDVWTLVGEAQAGITWAIVFGTLAYGTTYQWKINATNEYGTTTGNTWSFTTISFDRILVSYDLITGGSGAGPYDDPPGVEGTDWAWTGENNMLTVRRLVVAVEDKIWYEDL